MRKWGIVGVMLAVAVSASAAPNIAQNTQKGSVLVFPDIDVRDDTTTIVRIQNDGNKGIWLRCHFMDRDKNRNDFAFLITRGQAMWFDAATGAGTLGANPFPGSVGAGMLICFAVDTDERHQIKWNHLSGTATVVNYGLGTAYQYSAWAFYAYPGREGDIVPPASDPFTLPPPCDPGQEEPDCTVSEQDGDQVLNLDGLKFDKCPATLLGQFSPEGVVAGLDPNAKGITEIGQARAVFVGCNLDLRQKYQRYDTKLTFDVWNENELKLTGAHDCADGWHETHFFDLLAEGDNFSVSDLKTEVARYRVSATKDDFICRRYPTATVGILGVQVVDLGLSGGFAKVGNHLTAVGGLAGFVAWTMAEEIFEGSIR